MKMRKYSAFFVGALWVVLKCMIFEVLVDARGNMISTSPATRRFYFNVEWARVTRLCNTRSILTVNGEYPGPTISVYEGDTVEIKVTNRAPQNTTLHWHGIRQYRTGWADGPAYITQCPIPTNSSYTYKFKVSEQRGTLWWHAHISWQRATVYGAFIIHPRKPLPFPTLIHAKIPLVLGEWWNQDVYNIETDTIMYGSGPNVSDAYTINGLPGPLYPCSSNDTFLQRVEPGKTYMLQIINAALSDELFFAVDNHTLTVVEVDATYVKPFVTPAIMITPGQTTTVLLHANHPSKSGTFPIAIRPYVTSLFPFDETTSVGLITYDKSLINPQSINSSTVNFNCLPYIRDTRFATQFTDNLKSLGSSSYPCKVPKKVDKQVMLTVSLNLQDCPPNKLCKGFQGKRFLASINNQSFVHPPASVLQANYRSLAAGELVSDFPQWPTHPFNFTGANPIATNLNTEYGSKLFTVPFGTKVELVFQDTSFLNVENHPLHIHGHSFFVVGSGFGNFDPAKDPARYNLVDPPERNTVGIPSGGWAAVRLKAENPGVWFVHCHIEAHTTWGMAMAFIVLNGAKPNQCILPPPLDLPSC